MNNKSIFVACDTSDLKIVKKIIAQQKQENLKLFQNLVCNSFILKMEENF